MLDIDWELLLRYAERDCALADRERFDDWLGADRRHRAFYDVIALGLADSTPPLDPPPAPHWRVAPRANRASVIHAPRRLGWLIAATLLAAAVLYAIRRYSARLTDGSAVAERTVITRPAERAIVRLDDGTQIVVAAQSTLRYPATQTGATRDVEVSGEAYFEVAHDDRRPFVVHANGLTIRDLGTVFDVRAYPSDPRVRVVVAEGRVAVHAARDARIVDRGHLAQWDSSGAVTMRKVDPLRFVAWTTGTLAFDATPLGDVAKDLTRWYGATVILGDSSLTRRDFTGSFDRESLTDALAIIARGTRTRLAWRGDTAVLVPSS
ncbi:MAG TPA: FecR domain-containing protein [Gemmatimonadaceae bacterium]|nr:FecR domain-containing protein [Gemmatimonadaceae bacterium]